MNPNDMTLDELRLFLAPHIASEAAFDGWTTAALASAATAQGVDADVAKLAFPGGAMDMVMAWVEHVDAEMARAWPAEKLTTLKIRERIRLLVTFRFEALAHARESLRRAQAIMAMPQNALRTMKRSWASADLMWRLAGDSATDYNHYTKRTLLAGIYSATMLAFIDDESEDFADTRAFLDRRIDGVMRFEKTKAKFTGRSENMPSLTRFLGRLRYPA